MPFSLRSPAFVLAAVLACVAVFASPAGAKLLQGHINTPRDFMFLGKFCFNDGGGHMSFATSHVEPVQDMKDGKMRLSFYNDQKGHDWYWPDVWKSDDSCAEKVAKQDPNFKNANNVTIVDRRMNFNFKASKQPHYWYIAGSDCGKDSDENMKMHIQIHWTMATKNGWYQEFSYEDADLLTIYLVFTILWSIGIFGVALGAFLLYRQGQYTFVVKLFDAAVIFTTISLISYLIHYSVYASDGHGAPGFLILGDALDMLSFLAFAAVLLLVAKGAALEHIDLRELKYDFIVTAVLYSLYIGFWMWQVLYPYTKPQSNNYKWNSPPGIVMLCIGGLIFLYFIATATLNFLRESQAERRYFTLVFATVFSLYFLYLPFMVAICEGVPPYYRWKTILSIKLSVQTIAYVFMCFLQWPSKLAKLFHLKTDRLVNPADRDEEDTPYGTL